MSKDSLEHLSALMDGEMTRETGLFLARRLGADASYREVWARYHLIRDCIQRPGDGWVSPRFGEELSRRLESEGRAPRRRVPRWLKPVSGGLIAAGVAAMALMVTGPAPTPQASPEAAAPARFTSPNILSAGPASEPVSYSPRLNSYLLRHNQVAGAAGRQGFLLWMPIMASPAAAEAEAAGNPGAAPAEQAPPETPEEASEAAR